MIDFVSEEYTLQDDTTCDGKIISSGVLVVKSQYLSCMQESTNFYWEQKKQQQVIIVLTRTIVNPCLDVVAVKDVHDNPKSIYNRNHARQDLQKYPIFLTDSDNDYIFEKNWS